MSVLTGTEIFHFNGQTEMDVEMVSSTLPKSVVYVIQSNLNRMKNLVLDHLGKMQFTHNFKLARGVLNCNNTCHKIIASDNLI